MPIKHAIWKIGENPEALEESTMESEAMLEQMIVREPSILSDRWLLIGQQVATAHGGRIDLLALNSDAQLIVIELKRHQTPREVVAQAIDYASWVNRLEPDRIAAIYHGFAGEGSLGDAFRQKFGFELDEEQLNGSHQIVIVAASLDLSTERIVNYLNDMSIAVNVVFFKVFQDEGHQYLSKAWLIDPIETEEAATATTTRRGPWNGEYYVSFGHGNARHWSDAVRFGFICAGGGPWYSRTLFMLEPGDRVWVNVPQQGYVGVGKVLSEPIKAKDYFVSIDGQEKSIVEAGNASYHGEHDNDDDDCEYFVPIEWIHTTELENAVREVGFFGNQNTVCRPRTPRWENTVAHLKQVFNIAD